jgi:ADP-heptose:LPS heptosyltransferase
MTRKPSLTVVEWHHMGDAVMALPFLRAVRAAGWELSVCATPAPAEVFRWALPGLEIGVFRPGVHAWWQGADWAGWRERVGADVAVCAWADPRIGLWMKRAGYSRRVGLPCRPENLYAREAAFLPPLRRATAVLEALMDACMGPLLTDESSRSSRLLHHQDNWKALAGLLGFELPAARFGHERAAGRRWLLHPGGRLPLKHWPASRWTELAQRLRSQGLEPLVVQGCGLPGVGGGVETVRMPASVGAWAEMLKDAGGLVGLDSFPAHLSAETGTRAVVLFGDMPAHWFAPRGPAVRLVTTPAVLGRLSDYPKRGLPLLHAVTPAMVERAVLDLAGQG